MSDTTNYAVKRLINFNNAAEGSILPPKQQGQTRVPYVSGLRILATQRGTGFTAFTLAWRDARLNASRQIDHYNVYYAITGTNNGQLFGPVTVQNSPATINIASTVPAKVPAGITFVIQTVFPSGLATDLTASPSTAGLLT